MEHLMDPFLESARCRVLKQMANRNIVCDDAEDAVQDAVARHCLCGKPGGTAAPAATEDDLVFWLVRVARNYLCDGYRHVAALPCVALYEKDALAAFTGQDVAEQVSLQVAVRQAWEGLRNTQRAVLQMRADGKTCAEAASALNVSLDAYKTRVHRAKERFAKLLIENGLDDPRECKSNGRHGTTSPPPRNGASIRIRRANERSIGAVGNVSPQWFLAALRDVVTRVCQCSTGKDTTV